MNSFQVFPELDPLQDETLASPDETLAPPPDEPPVQEGRSRRERALAGENIGPRLLSEWDLPTTGERRISSGTTLFAPGCWTPQKVLDRRDR